MLSALSGAVGGPEIESRTNLVEWATRWADEARTDHTPPTLVTVCPESYRASYAFAAVIGSYGSAAFASRIRPGC